MSGLQVRRRSRGRSLPGHTLYMYVIDAAGQATAPHRMLFLQARCNGSRFRSTTSRGSYPLLVAKKFASRSGVARLHSLTSGGDEATVASILVLDQSEDICALTSGDGIGCLLQQTHIGGPYWGRYWDGGARPLQSCSVAQASRRAVCTLPVREHAHHTRATPSLTQQPFKRLVCPYPLPPSWYRESVWTMTRRDL
jgi:hypothetical protein